jgi:tRNA 2-thiouridine synthesizing protein A
MSDTLGDIETMEFQKDLDARGLNCPLPILKAKKALAEMQSGEVLRIVATDSGSVRDFQAFAKQTGNALLSHTQTNGEFTFLMRRKEAPPLGRTPVPATPRSPRVTWFKN